jgi:tRNA1Val (adenine37-N6)-methyltransferase
MSEPATCLDTSRFSQPARGYRFSADAVALAGFAQAYNFETVLDLCSGCGVIPILMWQRSPFRQGVGVELDLELATLAQSNVVQFGLANKVTIIKADIRSLSVGDLQAGHPGSSALRFDVITANPPYWAVGRGRLNPNLQMAAARHETSLTVADLFSAVHKFLKPGGRFYLSHLESRRDEILESFGRAHLLLHSIQQIPDLADRLLFEAHMDPLLR